MFYQEPIMAAPLGAFSISPGVEFLRKTNPSSEEKKNRRCLFLRSKKREIRHFHVIFVQ